VSEKQANVVLWVVTKRDATIMLSRSFRPESLGASGISQAFCILEQIMSTDPKKQDEIKDEELENVSGGDLDSHIPPDTDTPTRPRRVQDSD
jgi:hypothetical protein